SAKHSDYAAYDNHDKTNSHQAHLRIVERDHLPGPWRDHCVNADECDDEHAMLLCHRSTELVRRPGDFSCRANVSGEDGQNGCDVTECNISAPCKPGSDENRRIGNTVGDLIVEFTGFRGATGSDRNHPIEHVRSQT